MTSRRDRSAGYRRPGVSRAAALIAGAVSVAGGSVVVAAWHLHWLWLLKPDVASTPITYNSALLFVLTGVAMIGAALDRRRLVFVASAGAVIGATWVLLEYVFDLNLGISQLFFRTSLGGPEGRPGQMASNTALCFLVVGGVLGFRAVSRSKAVFGVTMAVSTLVGIVAGVALAGYIGGKPQWYKWGGFTAMPVPATVLFLVLTAGLLMISWADTMSSIPEGAAGRSGSEIVARPWDTWSVRWSTAFLALVTLVPLGVMTYTAITLSVHAVDREARKSVHEAAVLEARAVSIRMESLRVFVEAASAQPPLIALLSSQTSPALDSLQSLIEELSGFDQRIYSVAVTDAAGTLLGVTPRTPYLVGTNFAYRDWYIGAARANNAYVSSTVQTAAGDRPLVVAIAAPIHDRTDGRVVGYLSIGYGLASMQEFVANFGATSDIAFTITDQRGATVSSATPTGLAAVGDEAVRRALEGQDGVLATDGPDGTLLTGYAAVPGIGWTVQASRLESIALEPVTTLSSTVIAIALMIAAAMAVALVIAARSMQRRVHAEHEVEKASKEVVRSNAELEQFAYVASHDLSEPLRAISGPIQLLARRYEGQLDAEADTFIGFAVDGCQRMQLLIDGLLAVSRVGRLEGAVVPVDCGTAMDVVLIALGPAIEAAGATVNVGSLPTVQAEPEQLRQVLQNLVANAVKFVAPGVTPVVSVDAERVESAWRISVTDNGIGIEARHRERIFEMFKRLHSRDEYPGTGIGLALVKKIVERRGGQIGLDDAPTGTGTRFWFTIPDGTEKRP